MKSKLIIKLIVTVSIIIVLLAGYCVLGIDYAKQRKVTENLISEITDIKQKINQTPMPPVNLAQRLAAAQANLSAVQSSFPGKPNSTQVINSILKLADECQVKAIPLATRQWSSEKGSEGYLVFRLSMKVSGDFAQLVNFVSRLEKGEFGTLVIENLDVTRIAEPAEEKAVSSGSMPVIASLDLAIYARSANPD